MIVNKFVNNKKTCFKVGNDYNLEKITEKEMQFEDSFSISIINDDQNEKLKLLVILSPIFIASFDNGNSKLEFLKKTIENSSYPYGLYPNFFDNFNKDQYFADYKDWDKNSIKEDIILNKDGTIDFYINPIPNPYLLSLISMINCLIEDDSNRKEILQYFAKMRDDIVINGRRSILANGIQAFYLNKYVVVRMIELIDFIKNNNPNKALYLKPIEDAVNKLKTPRNLI